MNICLPPITLPSFSFPSSFRGKNGYGDKVREVCSSIASRVFFQALLVIFIFQFGVVGMTIGAVAGALVGFKNKMSFMQDVVIGAVSGAVLSQKVVTATFDHLLHFDDDDANQLGCFLHLIEILAGDLEEKLLRDHDHIFLISKVASCEKLIKVPKVKISKQNIVDSSGNATCCSICLQDFEAGNVAGSFPVCGHVFHENCISKWLCTHTSCPVCRRSL